MWIKQISIHGFGKLRIVGLTMNPNLNILHGPNESGKTSLACFLLNALSEPGEELQRYEPWEFTTFGGEIEFEKETLAVDFMNRNFSPPYKRSLLESTGFIFEEEKFDVNTGADGTLVANLKRKMEETDTGRILSVSIENLDNLLVDIPSQITVAKETLTDVERKIDAYRASIEKYNSVYKQKKYIIEKIGQKETEKEFFEKIFNDEKKKYIVNIKGKISSLETDLGIHNSRYEELKWVEEKSKEDISNALRIATTETEKQDQITSINNLVDDLIEKKSSAQEKLNSALSVLRIDHPRELEKIFLKIKNLTFLRKMYQEKRSIDEEYASPEPSNALWEFFSKNENILDEVEEAEYKSISAKDKINQEIESVQSKLKKINPQFFIAKYTAIISLLVFILTVSSKVYRPDAPAWVFVVSGISVILSVLSIIFWVRTSTARGNIIKMMLDMEEYSAQNAWYNKPGVWQTLNSLGIEDKTALRKAYIEYINHKNKQTNKPVQTDHMNQIENEIQSIIKEFDVGDDDFLSIDAAIGHIEKAYSDAQECYASQISCDEQIKVHRTQKGELEKDIKSIQTKLSDTLVQVGMSISEIKSYEEYYNQFMETKVSISEITGEIESLNKKIDLVYMPEELTGFHTDVVKSENELKDLNIELNYVSENLDSIEINTDEIITFQTERDGLLRQLETMKAIPKRISIIKEIEREQLNKYIGNYGKKFKQEFSHIFNRIVDRKVPIAVKDNLTISLTINGKLSNPEFNLSKSTYDQMLFAYKLSLYKILTDVSIPLVIDNAFMNYDDKRLKNVMDIIMEESQKRQVILLTSDQRLMEYNGQDAIDLNTYSAN